jgi:drug/metabolite transporter (DMT)-like permease
MHLIWFCAGIFFLNGLLNAGIEYVVTAAPQDNRFLLLSIVFFVAAALASARGVRTPATTLSALQGILKTQPGTTLALLLSSAIGLSATFIANQTALGASRNQFVDYSLTPLITLGVGYLFDSRTPIPRQLMFGIVGCLVGMLFILFSLFSIPEECLERISFSYACKLLLPSIHWQSLALGIACALASSLCGALNLLFTRRLSQSAPAEVILPIRLLPPGVVLLGIAVFSCDKLTVSGFGVSMSIGLAVLLFLFFWFLYSLLKGETLARIAPFLFLIPVSTFLFSLYPFQLRGLPCIPGLEWFGMAVIVGALALIEFGGRLKRRA